MKKYFDIMYPVRLKDVKKDLDKLSAEFVALSPDDDEQIRTKGVEIMEKFRLRFNSFLLNTQLHLTYDSIVPDEKYLYMARFDYIHNFFGKDTATGKIFNQIYYKENNKK